MLNKLKRYIFGVGLSFIVLFICSCSHLLYILKRFFVVLKDVSCSQKLKITTSSHLAGNNLQKAVEILPQLLQV